MIPSVSFSVFITCVHCRFVNCIDLFKEPAFIFINHCFLFPYRSWALVHWFLLLLYNVLSPGWLFALLVWEWGSRFESFSVIVLWITLLTPLESHKLWYLAAFTQFNVFFPSFQTFWAMGDIRMLFSFSVFGISFLLSGLSPLGLDNILYMISILSNQIVLNLSYGLG